METLKQVLMAIGLIAVLWAVICAIVSYWIVYVRPSDYIRSLSDEDGPEKSEQPKPKREKKPDKFIW